MQISVPLCYSTEHIKKYGTFFGHFNDISQTAYIKHIYYIPSIHRMTANNELKCVWKKRP